MDKCTTLKDLYMNLQQQMLNESELSRFLLHPGDKGDNSEKSWVKWFTNSFPNRYRASKAIVIDCHGQKSDQIDVVIYDAQYSHLIINQNGVCYIPAESVYAVFEVKQCINKGNMIYAGKKVESVRRLFRTSAPIPHAGGLYPPKPLHHIIAGVLTTRSDWKVPFGGAFNDCLLGYNDLQRIDLGCILNTGAFYYDYKAECLNTSTKEEGLVFFFLKMLDLLQAIGTVPAINYKEYMKELSVGGENI